MTGGEGSGAERYARMFARLAERQERAFVPFTVLGDPDAATSLEIVRALARAGADALELGIPFSDPVADGPAIQAADLRAMSAGVHTGDAWQILSALRSEFPELPIGLLVYANLVLHDGADQFYAQAAGAGVDSVLVADAPLLESAPLERSAIKHGIAPVLIASPNISDDRLCDLSSRCRGYVYVTARPGVTGAPDAAAGSVRALHDEAADVLRRLRALPDNRQAPPPLVGFGISTPEQVRQVLALGAAGAISGSAIARRIERHRDEGQDRLLAELERFTGSMKAATRN